MKIGTARDLRRLDQSVIADYGVSQTVLMENAAIAARDVIRTRWSVRDRDILIVCGIGSNGGDGFALARLLYARGAAVTVLVAGNPEDLKSGSAENYRILRQLPLEIILLETGPNPPTLERMDFESYHLIVDALFGIGLSRPLDARLANLVSRINASKVPVLALDIPSGVSADTGEILGAAIRADATVTFGLPKRGNLIYPGAGYGGILYHSEISFPPEVTGDEEVPLAVNIPPRLPPRDPAGHKGSFGRILVIAGSPAYRGAPALTAISALRSGAGYVLLATPGDLVSSIFVLAPEVVFLPMGGSGPMGSEHLGELLERAEECDSVVIGPGLSTDPESTRLAREFIAATGAPVLIDGDALTAIAGREEITRGRRSLTFLTPHPGEMARLLGSSVREVETRRVDTALEAADRYGACVVLKGARSVIAEPGGSAWLNLTGNSGMGTAGSGDALAGIAAALMVRFHGSTSPADSLRVAVHVHGLAGDLAADELGEDGMTAGDIARHVPAALAVYQKRIDMDPFSGRIVPV